jgi:hypothetical protein
MLLFQKEFAKFFRRLATSKPDRSDQQNYTKRTKTSQLCLYYQLEIIELVPLWEQVHLEKLNVKILSLVLSLSTHSIIIKLILNY